MRYFRTIVPLLLLVLGFSCGSNTPGSGGTYGATSLEQVQFLLLVNEFRSRSRNCGGISYPPARALNLSVALNEASRLHSAEMAANQSLSHSGNDGSRFDLRAKRSGYTGCPKGENIAYHSATVAEVSRVFGQWEKSSGHCRNLMAASPDELGFGFAVGKVPGSTRSAMYYTMITGDSGCR